MVQNTAIFPNITQKIDKLKILLFWEILKDKNPLLLDPEYSIDKVYSLEEKQYLSDVWEKLYDAYFELKDDSKTKRMLLDSKSELFQLAHINNITKSLDLYIWTFNHRNDMNEPTYFALEYKAINLIKEIDPSISINSLNDFFKNKDKVERKIKALTNAYNRNKKKADDAIDRQVKNIFTAVARVGKILEMRIDVNAMVVPEWIAWEKMAQEISKPKTGKK